MNVALAAIALFYLVAPIFVIFPLAASSGRFFTFPLPGLSTQWYVKLWTHPGYLQALGNTIIVGSAVALAATALGTMAALAVVRGRLPYGRALSAAILSPLVLPQIILAIGIFPVLAQLSLIGNPLAIILAHTAVATPLVFVTVTASLRGYRETLELAAMTLGADRLRTFFFVTLPMIRLGMIVGAIFAFAFSFDEIIIALFLTDASSITLPVFMWNELRFEMDPTIAAASTVVIVLSMSMLSAVALLQRRGRRARQRAAS